MDVFSNFFSSTFEQHNVEAAGACLPFQDAVFNALPASHQNINAAFVKNNLAIIPGEWESGDLLSSFYDINPTEPCMSGVLSMIKASDFIAFDNAFLDVIGPDAQLETIQSFAPDKQNVHEAPVYLPETNELLYSDTSLIGTLFAVGVDSPHTVRTITTTPPLANVNGGTYHNGTVYITTNGSPVRGIYTLNTTTGQATAILNNYRGRHFNSPNDLIVSPSTGHIYFTDPTYGQYSSWPGVREPELPNAIYRFDPTTKTLTALSNSAIHMPNGLALSPDEKTLYVADSSSTSFQLSAQRAVFAFDFTEKGLLHSPKLVYQVESGWPDGLRVTKSGLLVVAVAGGADVVDPKTGVLLGRINTPGDIIFNVEPARGEGKEGVWLLTGKKAIYKAIIREGPVEFSSKGRAGMVVQDVLGWAGLKLKE